MSSKYDEVTKYDLLRKANSPVKRVTDRTRVGSFKNLSDREGSNGDFRIVKTNKNLELNVKHNNTWYKLNLKSKKYKEYIYKTKLETLQVISNTAIAASGTIGLRVYKYKNDDTSVGTIGNYNLVSTVESDNAIVRGKLYSFPLGIEFEKGDIMLLAMKAKATASFTNMYVNFILKEFYEDLT